MPTEDVAGQSIQHLYTWSPFYLEKRIMQTVASDLVVSDAAMEMCHNWGWDPEVGIGRRSHLVKTGLENFPKSPTPGHQRWEPRISFRHIFVLCIGPNSVQEQLQSVGKGARQKVLAAMCSYSFITGQGPVAVHLHQLVSCLAFSLTHVHRSGSR